MKNQNNIGFKDIELGELGNYKDLLNYIQKGACFIK